MKKLIGIISGGAVILFLALGIARTRQEEETLSISKIQRENGVPVVVMIAQPGSIEVTRRYYGDLRAGRQAEVASKLQERIDRILVKVGDYVKPDQALVLFDTTASQAAVVQLRLAMENARTDYERVKNLFEQGALSQQTMDGVKLGYDIALENYQNARRSIILRAPLAGRVARLDLIEGQVPKSGDVVLTIIASDELEVVFQVSSEDRSQLTRGQEVRISREETSIVTGRITQISLSTGDKSRLFPIFARIPAAPGYYPGSMVNVDVTLNRQTGMLSLPVEAVLTRGGQTVVVVIDKDQARLQPVKTGLRSEDRIAIQDGIKAGDIVAIYGHSDLRGGEKVKIVEMTGESRL
ncbi:MAG: efflux RND transporter periplasmic adaptor subunit [Calditrichota bacterium]